MTTCPAASTPCTWKTDFAMSRPIVVIVCMDAPLNRGSLNSAHIHGTHVPVEEPSTASIGDIARCLKLQPTTHAPSSRRLGRRVHLQRVGRVDFHRAAAPHCQP